MDRQLLTAAGVTILGGALSGGITNAIAIWMLFRPHESTGFGPFRLQGAIPKNKARLAKSIGKTVGEKLLTSEDLAERLSAPPVRAAFDDAVGRAIRGLLDQEHGSLRSHLGPAQLETVQAAIGQLAARLAERLMDYTGRDEFDRLMEGWIAKLKVELTGRPVGELLTPGRREALAGQVDRWVGAIADSEGLEQTLRGWVVQQLAQFERDERRLADRLPPGLLGPIEQMITDAIPAALERLGELLADPEAKATVQKALREAFDTAAKKLLFHERLMAKFVVNDKSLARLLDGFEGEGFDRLADVVSSSPMRERIAGAVRGGLTSVLSEPLGNRLNRLPPPRRTALEASVGDWLVDAARSDGMRASLREALAKGLDQAGDLTWDQVLENFSGREAANLFRSILGGERGQGWIENALTTTAGNLLDRPIGRPTDWLGPEETDRVLTAMTSSAWGWVQGQIPMVATRLNIPEMVEQKINGFPLPLLEDIIRRVIDKELRLIVQLGWVLGAIVGLMTFAVSYAVR